jgi:hypothetical protein
MEHPQALDKLLTYGHTQDHANNEEAVMKFKVGDRVVSKEYGMTGRVVRLDVNGTLLYLSGHSKPFLSIEFDLVPGQRNTLEEETNTVPPRARLLRESERLITGDRNKSYGEPSTNFQNTATIWTTLLSAKLAPGEKITSGDLAAMMIALKLCRRTNADKDDNWVDIAGYAALGYEVDTLDGRIEGVYNG